MLKRSGMLGMVRLANQLQGFAGFGQLQGLNSSVKEMFHSQSIGFVQLTNLSFRSNLDNRTCQGIPIGVALVPPIILSDACILLADLAQVLHTASKKIND